MLVSALSLLISGVVARPHIAARQAGAQAFASSNDESLKLSQQDAPTQGAPNAGGASQWSLSLDDTDAGKLQEITGFGAAVTDSTVSNYNALSDDQKAQLIKDMVSADGANFQLLRHTIASSDMSAKQYSYDDNDGNADPQLSSFALGQPGNDMAAMLKSFRDAQPDLTILGSSWTPPTWMKTDGNTLNMDYADAFAQYFVKYLKAYSDAGAPIDAITIQNEPLHNDSPNNVDFTMGVSAEESTSLIQNNVGPALSAAGLSTKVWAYDHNTDDSDYPNQVLSGAGQYVDAVAWHCYAQGGPDWSVLSDFQNSHSGVKQYMTECYTFLDDQWDQTIGFTMGPLQNYASGAISWPMGTDTGGNPHLDDGCSNCAGLFRTDGSSYALQRDYYMLAQFSKWMPKGATVHATKGSYSYDDGTGVQAVATVNPDGSKTIVMQNNFNNPIYLTLNVTSGGTQWNGQLYPQSLTTWILPA